MYFKKKIAGVVGIAVATIAALQGTGTVDITQIFQGNEIAVVQEVGEVEKANQYYGTVNDNIPTFTDDEKKQMQQYGFEYYGDLDKLGRCTYTLACVGKETMPTTKRGSIGMIKPTGWQISKYDFVDGKYLYNRCHLIGYQLTGENANEKNLITGTRSMNTEGMLPFENKIAEYVKTTGNHVMYKVVPIFEGNNLVASGVHMIAQSIEDDGEGVKFNVYCYNIEKGVLIDYKTGDNSLE